MTGLTELPALNQTRFSSIRAVKQTGSTNADLLALAADGEPEGSVLVTDHQTAGRGRQDRAWHDDPGNALLVSILLRPERRVAPLVPLLTGVAAVEAVASLCGSPSASETEPAVVGLKWPNDVLAPRMGERKLAGILAESSTVVPIAGRSGDVVDDSMIVVTGMGLNLRWGRPPPPEIDARAATLSELVGREVERDEILHRYLQFFEVWLRRVEADGAGVLLDRYRRHCLTIGRDVRFATAATEYRGTVSDVSDSGTLLLETAEHGLVELHAGDAHHVPIGSGHS